MSRQPTLLLIDDDEQLAAPLKEYFKRFNLNLFSVLHPVEGLKLLDRNKFDLVILDVMLPEMDGFEVCREIRKKSRIPILMLTARGEVTDRVVGLELGADDYLPKPFEPRELVARIRNALRRAPPEKQPVKFAFDGWNIDAARREVTVAGSLIELTTMEYEFLLLLANEPGKVFSRDEILNNLRGVDAELFSRAVDILVSRVRKKLLPLRVINTVRGAGYRLVAPDQ